MFALIQDVRLNPKFWDENDYDDDDDDSDDGGDDDDNVDDY